MAELGTTTTTASSAKAPPATPGKQGDVTVEVDVLLQTPQPEGQAAEAGEEEGDTQLVAVQGQVTAHLQPEQAKQIVQEEKKGEGEGALLFVYGSLRPDVNPHMHTRFLPGAQLLGPASFQGRMYVVDKREEEEKGVAEADVAVPRQVKKYPVAVPSEVEEDVVEGMLFRLPHAEADRLLKEMDEYADCAPEELEEADLPPHIEYRRTRVRVKLRDNGGILESWMYIWIRPIQDLTHLPHGDYVKVTQ